MASTSVVEAATRERNVLMQAVLDRERDLEYLHGGEWKLRCETDVLLQVARKALFRHTEVISEYLHEKREAARRPAAAAVVHDIQPVQAGHARAGGRWQPCSGWMVFVLFTYVATIEYFVSLENEIVAAGMGKECVWTGAATAVSAKTAVIQRGDHEGLYEAIYDFWRDFMRAGTARSAYYAEFTDQSLTLKTIVPRTPKTTVRKAIVKDRPGLQKSAKHACYLKDELVRLMRYRVAEWCAYFASFFAMWLGFGSFVRGFTWHWLLFNVAYGMLGTLPVSLLNIMFPMMYMY